MDEHEAPITFELLDSENVSDWLHDCWQDLRIGVPEHPLEAVLVVGFPDRIRVFYCGQANERETLRLLSWGRVIVKAGRCG